MNFHHSRIENHKTLFFYIFLQKYFKIQPVV